MATRHTIEKDGSVTQRTIGSMTDDHYLASVIGATKTTAFISQNDPLEMAMSNFPTPHLGM